MMRGNAQNAGRRGPPPAVPLGDWQAAQLGFDQFEAGNASQVNAMYQAGYVEVPRGQVWRFRKHPNTAYFKGILEGGATNPAITRGAGNWVIDLEAVTPNPYAMVRSQIPAPALPTSQHPDVIAFSRIAPGTWNRVDVTALDFANNTITVDESAAGDDEVKVYFLIEGGEVQLSVNAPEGISSREIVFYNDPLTALHEQKQVGIEAPRFFSGGDTDVPERFRLAVNLKCTPEVVWTAEAEHRILIPYFYRSIQVNDRAELTRLAVAGLEAAASR